MKNLLLLLFSTIAISAISQPCNKNVEVKKLSGNPTDAYTLEEEVLGGDTGLKIKGRFAAFMNVLAMYINFEVDPTVHSKFNYVKKDSKFKVVFSDFTSAQFYALDTYYNSEGIISATYMLDTELYLKSLDCIENKQVRMVLFDTSAGMLELTNWDPNYLRLAYQCVLSKMNE